MGEVESVVGFYAEAMFRQVSAHSRSTAAQT